MDDYVTAGSVRRTRGRPFYVGISLAIAPCILVGFGPTYFVKGFFDQPALPLLVHAHGLVFSTWIALFVIQAMLVNTGHTAIHRRLGLFGVLMAILVLILGTAVTLDRAPLFKDLEDLMYALSFADLIMFAAFFSAAIYCRKRSDYHKRLMLLATVAIIDAGVNRLPFMELTGPMSSSNLWHHFVLNFLTNIPLFASLIYDGVTRRIVHPVFLWGGLILVASQVGRVALIETEWWQAVTAYLLTHT